MNLTAELIIRHPDFLPYREFLLQESGKVQRGKTHLHHIIPRYFSGSDAEGNLIKLSVANHLQAHILLCKGLHNLGSYKDRKLMRGAVKLLRKSK